MIDEQMKEFWNKIMRRLAKLRLQPIRVFCLHHVCAEFDAESMNECDWMHIEEFKQKVLAMQHDGVVFISLVEAYRHICSDWIRNEKYAVLTFDDGYASLKEILPWLEAQQIPAMLFINGKYLDGKSYREYPKEQYLTKKELFALTSPLINIGSHGWEHVRATEQTEEEFMQSMELNIAILRKHPRYIPFHAYTWGKHTATNDKQLVKIHIIPVLIDGMTNVNDKDVIHRELLDV